MTRTASLRALLLTSILAACGLIISFGGALAAPSVPPEAVLSGNGMDVRVYLPDSQNGFYRGSRFDWSGMIADVRYANHRYFAQWSSRTYPPVNHAAGTAEEFDKFSDGTLPPGYADAKAVGLFLKIGVGWLQKGTAVRYSSFVPYPVIDSGKWTIVKARSSVTMTQTIPRHDGYDYVYTKQIVLDPKHGRLTIHHLLRNTGMKPIASITYCHNFVNLDGDAIGPDYHVALSFMPGFSPISPLITEDGKEVGFNALLISAVQTNLAQSAALQDGATWTIRDTANGASLSVTTTAALDKCALYAEPTVLCVEPYVSIHLKPGDSAKWDWTYVFQPKN